MVVVTEVCGSGGRVSFADIDRLCARYPWLRSSAKSPEELYAALARTAVLVPAERLGKAEPPAPPPAALHRRVTAFDAAGWLAGEPARVDERRALWIADGNELRAAILAHGLEDSEGVRESIRAWLRAVPAPVDEWEPVRARSASGAEPAGSAVRRALRAGMVRGRGRVLSAADSETGTWTLAEDQDSAAARAGAFHRVASEWGLGHFVEPSYPVELDGRAYAATLDRPGAAALGTLAAERHGLPRVLLAARLQDGTLHRLAALDYLLGNPDRLPGSVEVGRDGQFWLCRNGRSFAEGFTPASDQSSFLPAYLRAWGPERWNSLTPAERRRHWPGVSDAVGGELVGWLAGLRDEPVKLECAARGLDPVPVLSRLSALREAASRLGFSQALATAWCG